MAPNELTRTERELRRVGLSLAVCALAGYVGAAVLLLVRPDLYLASLPGAVVGSTLGLGVALAFPYNPARFEAQHSDLAPAELSAHIERVRYLMARWRGAGLVALGHSTIIGLLVIWTVETRGTPTAFTSVHAVEATVGIAMLAAFAVICSGWASQMLITRQRFCRNGQTSL